MTRKFNTYLLIVNVVLIAKDGIFSKKIVSEAKVKTFLVVSLDQSAAENTKSPREENTFFTTV